MFTISKDQNVLVSDPPIAKSLFGSTRWAWIWLLMRLYLGYQWLTAGWGKLENPGWMQTGEALKGFWQKAAAVPETAARRVSRSRVIVVSPS